MTKKVTTKKKLTKVEGKEIEKEEIIVDSNGNEEKKITYVNGEIEIIEI